MPRLLVVDDEFAVLHVLALAFESEGYEVVKAGDATDALRALHSQPVDLVVCDHRMPLLDGPHLIEAMAANPRLADIPVVLIRDDYDAPAAVDARIVILKRPLLLSILLAVVAERLAIR